MEIEWKKPASQHDYTYFVFVFNPIWQQNLISTNACIRITNAFVIHTNANTNTDAKTYFNHTFILSHSIQALLWCIVVVGAVHQSHCFSYSVWFDQFWRDTIHWIFLIEQFYFCIISHKFEKSTQIWEILFDSIELPYVLVLYYCLILCDTLSIVRSATLNFVEIYCVHFFRKDIAEFSSKFYEIFWSK